VILIADSGSTSCDWAILNPSSLVVDLQFKTKGLNPTYLSTDEIKSILNNSIDILKFKDKVSLIYFFGAGCNSHIFKEKLEDVFQLYFSAADKVSIQGDIQGAVYACTSKPGVVGILGTGSNICYYDGSEIHFKLDSLGYSIMDDGAGSALGRQLLRAYFYKQMPNEIAELFSKEFNINPDYLKENLYSKPFAGRFLASYAKFVLDNKNDPFMNHLLTENLEGYFESHVSQYAELLKNIPIHFVGSIAYFSKIQLEMLCLKYKFKLGNVIQSPINYLAKNIKSYL